MLSVDLQSDRASCDMKSSKTGSWSGRRAPRAPAELGYSSRAETQPADCLQISEALQQSVAVLIMFDATGLTAHSFTAVPSKPLTVGDSPDG